MTELEYEPLSDDAKAALREARFKTVNVAHTFALIYDSRPEIFTRLGISALPFERVRGGGLNDHEAVTANPEIIALCALNAAP